MIVIFFRSTSFQRLTVLFPFVFEILLFILFNFESVIQNKYSVQVSLLIMYHAMTLIS